jgi:hypothetical protein
VSGFELRLVICADPHERAARAELYQIAALQLCRYDAAAVYHRAVCRAEIVQNVMTALPPYLGVVSRHAPVRARERERVIRSATDADRIRFKTVYLSFSGTDQVGEGDLHNDKREPATKKRYQIGQFVSGRELRLLLLLAAHLYFE